MAKIYKEANKSETETTINVLYSLIYNEPIEVLIDNKNLYLIEGAK